MSPEIVFGEDRLEYLADLFDKEVDDDDYLYDPEEEKYVTDDVSGERVKIHELGVVHHNSEHFVKDNVGDLLEYSENDE